MPNATIPVLQSLIDVCRDGRIEFEAAAQDLADPEARAVLLDCAHDCLHADEALLALLGKRDIYRDPPRPLDIPHGMRLGQPGRFVAADLDILFACERIKRFARDCYHAALEKDLDADVREVVSQQNEQLLEDHAQLLGAITFAQAKAAGNGAPP